MSTTVPVLDIERRFHGTKNVICEERDGLCIIRENNPAVRHVTVPADVQKRSESPDLIDLSFSSESPVKVYGEDEILSHHVDDVDLKPISEVGAILKNHDERIIIGAPEKVWIDETSRKGRLTMRFGTTDEAKKAQHEAIIDKTLRGTSVGFTVQEWVYLKDAGQKYREIAGPAWVAAKWRALEASLTPIPADPSVGVNRSIKQEQERTMKTPEQIEAERVAKEKAEREAQELKDKQEREAKEKAERDAKAKADSDDRAKAEVERSAAICTICQKHGIDPLPHIRSGEPLEAIYQKILDQITPKGGTVERTTDGRDSFRDAAMEGLLVRTGAMKREDCKHGGEHMVGYSLMEYARESLRRANLSTKGDKLTIAARALAGPRMDAEQIAAFMARKEEITVGTSDFPLLLAAAAGKTLQAEFAATPTHYELWCAIGNVPDFKEVQRIEFSEIGDLPEIPELAPYTQAKFKGRKETNRIYTYGKIFGLSRQAVINDDLDGFLRIPRAFARSAARLPQHLAIKKLLENPTLVQDSVAVFAAGHGNLKTGSEYRLDTLAHAEAGLIALRGMLGKMRAPVHADNADEAAYLNLLPRTLLVNADDEFIAAQAVNSAGGLQVSNSGVINPINAWRLQVIVDQNIANTAWGGTATQWFMFSDPADAPVIEVVFLNGQRTPYMEEEDQTNVDGRFWKVRLDTGVNAIGFRGAIRADGA